MTIQFYPNKNMVRLGEKYFPAKAFPGMDDQSYLDQGRCIGYEIPIGETGEFLSIAIGILSYSDNHHFGKWPVPGKCSVDPSAEMVTVEVGYDFRSVDEYGCSFDVKGFVNDEELIEMIGNTMSGLDPWERKRAT